MTDSARTGASPVVFPLAGRRIFVAGSGGMVGSAVRRRLAREPGVEILAPARRDLDLRRQADVDAWFKRERPEVVVLAAAKVGGILANDAEPALFLYDNLLIAANIIEAARATGTLKLLFLGSSCIYPKFAPQPIPESALLDGRLEPTNGWYALAKIAGLKLCQAYRRQWGCDFISAMPTNLYGPGDGFDLQRSHVIPALIRKMHEAKLAGAGTVTLWGSGDPRREFLHVDDLAEACIFLLERYSGEEHVNVGSGSDLTIAELARLVASCVGYRGQFVFDRSRPDGTPRKLLDTSKLTALGWSPLTRLGDGIASTYAWYVGSGAAMPSPAVSRSASFEGSEDASTAVRHRGQPGVARTAFP